MHLISTQQCGHYDPTVTQHPMLSCFLLQTGIWIIQQQHSVSGLEHSVTGKVKLSLV